MSATPRPDVERELAGLKDFQRATVDRVARAALGRRPHPALPRGRRGRARQDAGRAWCHRQGHRPPVGRPSTASTSSTSAPTPRSPGRTSPGCAWAATTEDNHADRLTLLARRSTSLEGRKLNFVSFSPGTSFNITGQRRHAEERVLLYWMLQSQLPRAAEHHGTSSSRAACSLTNFEPDGLLRPVLALHRRSAGVPEPSWKLPARGPRVAPATRLRACAEEFKYKREGWSPDSALSSWRYRLIGRMRQQLARSRGRSARARPGRSSTSSSGSRRCCPTTTRVPSSHASCSTTGTAKLLLL